jgi:hypothetical protein
MPFYLKESNALPQLAGLQSVLIVPCRFCPAASLAVREKQPYLQLLRRLLRTEAYESFIKDLKRRLQDKGIKTAIFDSKLLHQFVACMWTSKRRRRLAKRATEFEGVVVLGCDAMLEAVRDSVDPTGCRVVQGMEIEGLMNVLPRVSLPCNLSLELQGVASVGKRPAVESSRATSSVPTMNRKENQAR